MRNLTITVDEETLRRARIRALEQGTSINRVLSDFLAAYAGTSPSGKSVRRALAVARSGAGSGSGGRQWRRDDLYDP